MIFENCFNFSGNIHEIKINLNEIPMIIPYLSILIYIEYYIVIFVKTHRFITKYDSAKIFITND